MVEACIAWSGRLAEESCVANSVKRTTAKFNQLNSVHVHLSPCSCYKHSLCSDKHVQITYFAHRKRTIAAVNNLSVQALPTIENVWGSFWEAISPSCCWNVALLTLTIPVFEGLLNDI